MRLLLGACLIAGCSFRHGALAPDAEIDAAPFCDESDPSLLVCFELEGSTRDASKNALHASMMNVAFVQGRTGLAAHVETSPAIDIAEHSLLDPPAITMEAWIRAPHPISGTRAGIVDNSGQYGFFLHPGGSLQCIGLTLAAVVPADTWTHVACTYDGTTRLYVDGMHAGETAGGGAPLGTGGSTGISIGADNPPGAGSPLSGDVDQVRIYSRARSDAEVCRDALRTDCPS